MANRWTLLVLVVLLLAGLPYSCGGGSAVPSQRIGTGERTTQLESTLLSELARLGVEPSRVASKPPAGAENMVNDLCLEQTESGWTLRWSYRNLGDYNQNGTVGVEDITPLAQHFQETWGAAEENSLTAVIDGSGNGTVGIEDVTPIAVNYGAELDHYVVETAPSASDLFTSFAQAARESFVDQGGRLIAELQMEILPARYFRIRAYDSEGHGLLVSDVFAADLPGPEITAVRPLTCAAGIAARFEVDATGEGQRTIYWEFGGGALPGTTYDEKPFAVFPSAGAHSCSVTVITPFGIDSDDFQVLVVEPGTSPYILDVQPQSGLEGTLVTFFADVGGDEPLLYSWDFGDAVDDQYSSEVSPEVTLTDTPGNYPVSLTVANAHGSDNYEFTLVVIEGLNMDLKGIRLSIENVTNTTSGSPYEGLSLFTRLLSGNPCNGAATKEVYVNGELEAIAYTYLPELADYGYDDDPPHDEQARYDATFSYLAQLLEWSIEHEGLPESELFTHDEMEPPGRLWGTLGSITGIYTVTVILPQNPFCTGQIELVIMLEVTD